VDARLNPAGKKRINLLDPAKQLIIEEQNQRHAVKVPVNSREGGIYKLFVQAFFA
jgi:hypothetical protein